MSDEIMQKLGFDASAAINTLKQLDGALANFEKGLNGIASAAGGFNKVGKQFDLLGKSATTNSAASIASIDRLTVSMKLMSRIVFTQFIVRALSQLRSSFQDTENRAIEFQRGIARIQTISGGAGFDQISDSVRKLSDNFNIPLLESVEGTYQAISNQVGTLGESLQFTSQAAQFAKATNSSLADSVDLLSGAIKSYGLTSLDTDKVASIFFTSIDKGRVTAEKLANSFGRVGPRAAELGVSLEELNATLDSISIRGTDTSESLTQLSGILTALQKPTPALRKVLEDLGFTSAKSAIQTLKLSGVLRALNTAMGGSAELSAKLFPNVRGLGGQAALAADDFKSLAENIEAMALSSRDLSASKALLVTSTDAEKATKEINKLTNALTVDLGQAVLKAGVSLSEFLGGADNVETVAKSLGPLLIAAGGGFLSMRASAVLAAAGLTTVAGALTGVTVALAAFAAGKTLGGIINEKLTESNLAGLKALEAFDKKQLDILKRRLSEERDEQNKADDTKVEGARKVFQELNKLYLVDFNNAKQASAAIVANTKAGFDNILSARQKLVDELAKAGATAIDIQKQSSGRQTDIKDRQGDRDFQQTTKNLSDAQKVFALLDRASSQARQAAADLAKAAASGDTEGIARAVAEFNKAQQTGETAQSIAERTGNRVLEAKAAAQLKTLSSDQLSAERSLTAEQTKRLQKLDQERAAQQDATNEIREQVKVATDNTGDFDASGNRFNAADQAKRAAARQQALQKVASLALSPQDLSREAALGVASFVAQFQGALSRDPFKIAIDTQDAEAKLSAALDNAFANARKNSPIDVSALEQALGKQFTSVDQIIAGMGEATKKTADLRAQLEQATLGGQGQTDLRNEIKAAQAELDKLAEWRAGTIGTEAASAGVAFDALSKTIADVSGQTKLSADDVNKVTSAIGQFNGALNESGFQTRIAFKGSSDVLTEIGNKLIALQQLQNQPSPAAAQLQQQLDALNRVIGTINTANPTAQFQGAATAIQSAVSPSQQIADNWARAAASGQTLSGAATQGFAKGGMAHFAKGGRGLDTIPAMLSAGEFVVNAKSSRQFFSQISAMNAGQQPVFRNDGGSVTNTVGDIIVNGAQSPKATAAAVMRELNRATRMGKGRLN